MAQPAPQCLAHPSVQVHDVGGRVAAVQRLLEEHGFAVHVEVHASLPGTSMVYAWQLNGSDGSDEGL